MTQGKIDTKEVVIKSTNGVNVLLNPETRFILSTSGSHSSMKQHNAALQKIGLDLVYFTVNREISPETYAGLLKSPIVRGGAVTGQGLKSEIIPYLDSIDKLAKEMGSVNTVVNVEGLLYGYNSDAFGFEKAMRDGLKKSKLSIKSAIIYGNGGVSGTAYTILSSMNIPVTMTGRNTERVSNKRKELGITHFEGPYDLIVNATPISYNPIEDAVGLTDLLNGSKIVFDHNMPEKFDKKNLLHEYCIHKDIFFIPGKEMYIPQMIKQWGLFFDGLIKSTGEHWAIESEITDIWNLK